MTKNTEIKTLTYRGREIQYWKSGDRWFAFTAEQNCDDNGYPSLTAALEQAERFVDFKISGTSASA